MATLGLVVANDIANAALQFYARGKTFAQTIQKKPLLGWLKQGQKTFPSGKEYISEPVQGTYMSDTAGFFSGYSQDTAVTFTQAQNILRAQYAWKEVHAGLIITWTELKQDGITVTDNQRTSQHSDVALTRLVGLLENRMDDYGESWARAMNAMMWADGSQDALQVPGIQALITTNQAAVVGGLDPATYTWWNNRTATGIVPNGDTQTLTETLRAELIQLQKFGGMPNKALCGSLFLAGLRKEIQAKGLHTMTGWEKGVNMGMGKITLPEVGEFEYDPTLDQLGLSKRCYVLDGRKLRLRPMEGEDNKVLTPERPYNYMVFLKSMTWTGGMEVIQRNACEIFEVA